MRRYINVEGHAIEGAAGVAIAALLERKDRILGQNVVVVICGGNIADEKLAMIMAGD
jgi:threonine dehydratase